MSQPRIGAGALAAFVRQGSKELAQLLPAFPSSLRVIEEPGALGNPTPIEVFKGKQPPPEVKKAIDMEMGR